MAHGRRALGGQPSPGGKLNTERVWATPSATCSASPLGRVAQAAIGAVLDGCPAPPGPERGGHPADLDRRAPGQSAIVTQRKDRTPCAS